MLKRNFPPRTSLAEFETQISLRFGILRYSEVKFHITYNDKLKSLNKTVSINNVVIRPKGFDGFSFKWREGLTTSDLLW